MQSFSLEKYDTSHARTNAAASQFPQSSFSSRSHDLVQNFVTSPNDISHQVESSERGENACLGTRLVPLHTIYITGKEILNGLNPGRNIIGR